ncbi:PREDICTED: uncharacterized protein LOC105124354 isoform X1 [Populus euphratica]|uniref:Uncharacterized protein LOC105124354 isoform X1 n=1 Tax=Populus euphratica TaxID=75702 RepID=A0AAJ6XL73_POPEU|nr:PREDICTED: uncharacterized protein LOC105124354 isoform X1 [Populus euphratica]XP_011022645.1 PREDICTED: uncharacterized protein LOC105124354 isoform X1 [Populus euphratica]XP_011022646.1 PREDICTED: uncharacterized protein LOC105124354 isoform X1 [Populus euphratica]
MFGTELCSSRILSPFREESGDEELSVLPRHTKVVVTGNNRTKSVLVGLQGVVKKALGLGGWHWLVLKNGSEVKLQRNALSVLEHPTGNEVDDDNDYDTSSGSDIDEHDFYRGSGLQKISKPRVRPTRPWVPSAPAKSTSESSNRDVQPIIHMPVLTVNLARLGTESLRRYCKEFKLLGVNSQSSREQMLNAAQIHFLSQRPLDETQEVAEFTRVAKRLKEKDKPSE